MVDDSNMAVCWLADANLAGNPQVRALVKLSAVNPGGSAPAINPDGTMDYETALDWVDALNGFNCGKGWLNHNNWQLPATAAADTTCTSHNGGDFGALCSGRAQGNLCNVGLGRVFPESVTPFLFNIIWPLFNLQPGLYWTSDSNSSGEVTFSFNTEQQGSNTTKYNYFHVLPMTQSLLGSIPPGSGVVPYRSGPGVGRAVYDTVTGTSWTLDANLAAATNLGVTGTTTTTSTVDGSVVTVPLVEKDGTVYFSAVDPTATTGWIVSMNARNFAGTNTWSLPGVDDLNQLRMDMGLQAGDSRLEWPFFVGPFWQLQPGFYWACERNPKTSGNAPCDLNMNPGTSPGPSGLPMQYSFNYDDGFLGTDENDKQFYVMVYYPAP